MGNLGSKTARVSLVLLITFALSITAASAGGWGHGPHIGHWGHGPNIAGWHPFYKPIPEKPLDGLVTSVNDLGKIIARPFEELGKSIKDPWGWQKKAGEWYNGGMALAATATAAALAAFKQFIAAFCLVFGFGFGVIAYAIARRRTPAARPIHPLHA
jgi:hypothetical protein